MNFLQNNPNACEKLPDTTMVIGITGGISTGKTSFCDCLREIVSAGKKCVQARKSSMPGAFSWRGFLPDSPRTVGKSMDNEAGIAFLKKNEKKDCIRFCHVIQLTQIHLSVNPYHMKKTSTLFSTFTKNRLRLSARLGLTALSALALAAVVSVSSAKDARKLAVVKSTQSVSAANYLHVQTGTPVTTGPASKASRFPAPAATQTILYDQTDSPGAGSTVSQMFEPANVAFDSQGADDFVVPAGGWTIGQVNVIGVYFNGPGPATSVNVTFYADAATLPGAAVAGGTYMNVPITAGAATGSFQIVLPTSLTLAPGTYWVAVQANLNFTPGGEWGWTDRTVQSNSGAAWENPGGGFATPCGMVWGRKTTCIPTATGPDNLFQLLTPPTIVCNTTCPDTGLILNGGFETGDFTSWTIDGILNPPTVVNTNPHSGTFSALIGSLAPPEPTGDSSFHQTFTVPAAGATLSFWHQNATTDSITFDWQDAYITDSTGVTILQTIFHVCSTTAGYVNQTVDMTPYAGQTVGVKFLVHQDGVGDVTSMYVDDVQLLSICSGPIPSSAVSRKVHGAAGTFDINLPLVGVCGAVGIEDRLQGGMSGGTTLWYNGDFNTINGLANEVDPTVPTGASVYDNFIVTNPAGWDVTAVFSDNLITTGVPVTSATWEIRSGVSVGNGGTLVASGSTVTPTVTPTGRSGFGFTEYQVEVTGLSVHLPQLGAGLFYWLNVTPTIGTGRSFDSDTSGANAIGQPPGNDFNAFFNSVFFAAVWQDTATQAQHADFSMGVMGTGGATTYPEQIVVTFPNPVTVQSVSVTSGTGTVGTFTVAGNVVTVNLTGVTDVQRLGVTLHGVCDGNTMGDVLIPMGVLGGDTNASGTVSAADVSQTKNRSGQTADAGNFRSDVNASGSINAGDVALVKNKSGNGLPGCAH